MPLLKLIKYARDLSPFRNREDAPSKDSTARKQLEAELETSCCSLGAVRCRYTAVLVSPVQSSPESRFYRDPNGIGISTAPVNTEVVHIEFAPFVRHMYLFGPISYMSTIPSRG